MTTMTSPYGHAMLVYFTEMGNVREQRQSRHLTTAALIGKAMNELVLEILKLQFKAVGRKYRKSYVDKPDWYLKTTWTTHQRDVFKKQFVALMRENGFTKSQAEKEFSYWDLCYGWTNV